MSHCTSTMRTRTRLILGAAVASFFAYVPKAAAHAPATAGAYNSCYESSDSMIGYTNPSIGAFCLQQWGSYPAQCGSSPTFSGATHWVSGQGCASLGKILNDNGAYPYTCQYGNFTNYNSTYSGTFTASTYTCSESPSASNVTVSYDSTTGNFTGSYTYSGPNGGPEGTSQYAWVLVPDESQGDAPVVGVATSLNVNSIDWSAVGYNSMSQQQISTGPVSGTLYFCVAPTLNTIYTDGYTNGGETVTTGAYSSPYGNGYYNITGNGWVCSSGYSSSTWSGPARVAATAASNVKISFQQDLALGLYTFNLGDMVSDQNSTYVWNEATDSKGDGSTIRQQNNCHSCTLGAGARALVLKGGDSGKFLQFCVTETGASLDGTQTYTGTQSCSAWTAVQKVAELFMDTDETGYSVGLPYKQYGSGACIDLATLPFNDAMSSFTLPATDNYDTTFIFYSDEGCSGSTNTYTVQAGQTYPGNTTSSWNDTTSSMRVVWNDAPSATNVTASFSNLNAVVGSYTYSDEAGVPESGSTYEFVRAQDANGTNATVVQSWSTSRSYSLQEADNNMYLAFCVQVSNGVSTAAKICSSYLAIGPLLTLYQNENFNSSGGASVSFAYLNAGYASGSCRGLANFNFTNEMTSFMFTAPSSASAVLKLYEWDGGVNCGSGGLEESYSVAAGAALDVSNIGTTWNDKTYYFTITW